MYYDTEHVKMIPNVSTHCIHLCELWWRLCILFSFPFCWFLGNRQKDTWSFFFPICKL